MGILATVVKIGEILLRQGGYGLFVGWLKDGPFLSFFQEIQGSW